MAVFRFDAAKGQICPKETQGQCHCPEAALPLIKFTMTTQKASAGTKGTNCGHRHLRFPPIIFRIYNVFRYNNLVLHFDTAIQSQCISSHAHTIQIVWSRAAPAYREHFRGGSSEVNRFKSSRHHMARRETTTSQRPKQSILVNHVFADLID
jgi:hypothetical protein